RSAMAVVVTPAHQFPSGVGMTADRRGGRPCKREPAAPCDVQVLINLARESTMTPQERQSLEEFLGQLTQVRGPVKDPEAAALIARAAAENPDALYLTVQRAILLEHALNAAKAQITQLQTQSGAGASSGFLTSHWGHAPEQPTRPAAPAASQPSFFGGGSFLGNVASTAAGVAAGAFLFQGIESLFSHHGGSFWGQPLTNTEPVENVTVNNFYGDEHESVHKVADEGSLLDTDFQDGGISDTDSDWV